MPLVTTGRLMGMSPSDGFFSLISSSQALRMSARPADGAYGSTSSALRSEK